MLDWAGSRRKACSEYAPTMTVLSRSSWCVPSMEGMVPESERFRCGMVEEEGWDKDGGERGV